MNNVLAYVVFLRDVYKNNLVYKKKSYITGLKHYALWSRVDLRRAFSPKQEQKTYQKSCLQMRIPDKRR